MCDAAAAPAGRAASAAASAAAAGATIAVRLDGLCWARLHGLLSSRGWPGHRVCSQQQATTRRLLLLAPAACGIELLGRWRRVSSGPIAHQAAQRPAPAPACSSSSLPRMAAAAIAIRASRQCNAAATQTAAVATEKKAHGGCGGCCSLLPWFQALAVAITLWSLLRSGRCQLLAGTSSSCRHPTPAERACMCSPIHGRGPVDASSVQQVGDKLEVAQLRAGSREGVVRRLPVHTQHRRTAARAAQRRPAYRAERLCRDVAAAGREREHAAAVW